MKHLKSEGYTKIRIVCFLKKVNTVMFFVVNK